MNGLQRFDNQQTGMGYWYTQTTLGWLLLKRKKVNLDEDDEEGDDISYESSGKQNTVWHWHTYVINR